MAKILYLSATQFSGTTLASFLLNQHPAVATVGHTMGWSFEDPDKFRCSCGERIADCPLFLHVAAAYAANGLDFRPDNFGTAFRVASNPSLNYYLTETLPRLGSSALERVRDGIVNAIPVFRRRLERALMSNKVFIDAVLDYWGAECYLDNSHSPFRMRRLAQDPRFDVCNIHLVRDPRGVSMSLMTNNGLDAEAAVKAWLKRQQDILRIAATVPKNTRVFYEELCLAPDATLSRIQQFGGVPARPFTGNFKDAEHHILGNRMRLSDGAIRLDERWKRDMTVADLARVESELNRFRSAHPGHELSAIIEYYLEEKYSAAAA